MNITIAVFILSGIVMLSTVAGPFDSREKIPAAVMSETAEQIFRCFGTNHVKGVPLLDQDVEWNSFTNWPDEFRYQGVTYTLKLVDVSGGDYSVELKSRSEVRPGMRFVAVYDPPNKAGAALKIGGQWDHEGSLTMRQVRMNGKFVFMHQFHPIGRLYQFVRDDVHQNYMIDWFDHRGELVGTTRGYVYRWREREVDHEQFQKEQLKVYQKFAE